MFNRHTNLLIKPLRKTGSKRQARQTQFESLEVRQVMATNILATLNTADGILKVEGTPNNDNLYLHNEAGKVFIENIGITVTNGGTKFTALQIASSLVKQIEVSALAGNDTIKMFENLTGGSVALPMTVYGGKGRDMIYGGSAADTLMGGDKVDSEQTGLVGAALDAKEKFYSAGAEWLNFSGMNEKWFFGQNNVWHYIKPNGEIWRSNGTPAVKIATVDPGYYTNLSNLLDADSGQSAAFQDRTLNLYSTGNLYQNTFGNNEKWVMSGANGKWHFITPDGTLYQQTTPGYAAGTLVASLDVSYWNDTNRLVNASTLFNDDDVIYGYGGKDALLGGGDSDTLYGGTAVDFIYGGVGNDTLFGDEDGDFMYANSGNDWMYGGDGGDEMIGGEGNDTAYGVAGNDIIWGGDDRNLTLYANDSDLLFGEAGNDIIHGGAGALDYLYGGDNDDELWGDDGVDNLYGGNGHDSLYGGRGTDNLYGEAGNDGLFGGWADEMDDRMSGGTGADRFLRQTSASGFVQLYQDVIADLAAEDAEVRFVYGNKGWTEDEVLIVDQALAWLHKSTNSTKLLKQPNGQAQYLVRQSYIGADIGGDNNHLGTIRITDLGATSGLAKVVVHEFAHNWDSSAQVPGFAALSGWTYHNLSAAPVPAGYTRAANMGVLEGAYASDGKFYCWIYKSNASFTREYGRTSPGEDFATCLEEYFAVKTGKSANTSSNWQAKYNFISTWLFNNTTF